MINSKTLICVRNQLDLIILLDNNVIGNEGAIALAEVLRAHKSITDLGICMVHCLIEVAENYIGDAGAEAMVTAATANEKIKSLSICKFLPNKINCV